MSRSRFMPLQYPRPPARWPPARWPGPRSPVLAMPRAPELERTAAPEPAPEYPRRHVPVLRLTSTLQPGEAGLLADSVLARVVGGGCEVGTVVLDLTTADDIGTDGCTALHALHDSLRSVGTQLRVVARGAVRDRLREAGLTQRLAPGAIHPSLRAAVLASYAALPGPGLVTTDVRAALAEPAESLSLGQPEG
jgi:anti-anti-sigma regulatory factor